jgi:dsDNA-specific endonuclease/ATPase MutS2
MDLKKSAKLEVASITAEAEKSRKETIAKIKTEADEKIKFYKANAQKIVERRTELGDYAKDINDKDIVNDDIFVKAKLEIENADLRAKAEGGNDTVGVKGRDDGFYSTKRAEINNKAYGHSNKEEK